MKKVLIFVTLTVFLTPIFANALLKTVDNDTYVMTDNGTFDNTTCNLPVEGRIVADRIINNHAIVFEIDNDGYFLDTYIIDDEGTCTVSTMRSLFDIGYLKPYGYEYIHDEKVIKIIPAGYRSSYTPSTDTTFIPDKYYHYHNGEGNSWAGIPGRNIIDDSSPTNYYNDIILAFPNTEEFEVGEIYYKLDPSFDYETYIVDETPTEAEFGEYYVETTVDTYHEFDMETIETPEGMDLTLAHVYDVIKIFDEDYVIVYDANKYYFYDLNGKLIDDFGDHIINIIYNDSYMILHYYFDENNIYSKIFNSNKKEMFKFDDAVLIGLSDFQNNKMDIYLANQTGVYVKSIINYKVSSGNGQTFNDDDLTITLNGNYNQVDKVMVNDTELDEDLYTMTSGSTIITLKKAYLETLNDGRYTLKVDYTDGGSAVASFLVGENPETFDGVSYYLIIGIIGIIGISLSIVINKKIKSQ